MISPYVRRLRLAQELRRLREEAGLRHEDLAKRIGENRAKISRLENGHIPPDTNDVIKLLDALSVDGDQWTQILTIAQDAATKGWWESTARAMGERQALYANLEAGAVGIREYQPSLVPGLLQTAEYARSRLTVSSVSPLADGATVDGTVEGRMGRQRMLRRPDGPAYEVVLDEVAVRRLSVPPPVMREQLLHLASKAADERIMIRVLPVDAVIGDYKTPMSSLSLYTYTDPGDPVVVAIEAATTDVVLTDPGDAARYGHRYDLLAEAALPAADSIEFITTAADRLSDDRNRRSA